MVNGSPHRVFHPQRGLRQGDSLSSYLFILCVEAIFALLIKSVELEVRDKSVPIISHDLTLFFLHTTIIFAEASQEEATHISYILKAYEETFSQRINFNKPKLSCSQNMHSTRVNDLIQLLGVKAMKSHKGIWLPTFIGRSKSMVFKFVWDRVWKKLKGWKKIALSKAGTEVLIKFIVQSIPTYVVGCFLLPQSICDEIESMTTCFFWGGDTDEKKNPLDDLETGKTQEGKWSWLLLC